MITKITGEAPFQVMSSNFSISPSKEGYTLQISADGKQYSNLFSVGAGVTRLVTGVAANSYYRLLGNQSQVSINWMMTCGGEGGGSGSGTELAPVTEFPLNADPGTVVALASGDTVSVYQYDGQNWNEIGGVDTEEIELPIAAAVNELKGDFETRLNQQYYKKAEVNDIAARKVEAAQVDEKIKDYVDPAIAEVNDTIEDKELPVSAALNKLNEDIATIDEVIPAAIVDINDRMVSSSTVKTIWRGSQNDYDAITVKDAATLYIII